MFIKASDRQALETTGVFGQILGLFIIILGFLIPTPLSIQILIALTVVFFIVLTEHIQNRIEFSQKEAAADSWIDTLAFRLAINKAISSAQRGEYVFIDWEQITQEAFEDIKRAYDAKEKIERIWSAGGINWLISSFAAIFVSVIYPLIGYGIALLVKTFFPGMAEGM